jgi:mycothiol synthase
VWSYAAHPAADALAARAGLVRVRELWRMRAPLPVGPAGDPPGPVALPAGVRVRTFDVVADPAAWLELNALAFGGHGEQGRLTRADLDARMATDWFDPAGFFLAERDGRLVGFHWTKEHPAGPDSTAAGEIYVLGVHPAEHGGGLGGALTRIGLRHLSGRGLPTALLYVDADNAPAVAVYRRMGFEVEASSVMFAQS